MGFLSIDLWKDLSDPYKYDNTVVPWIMLIIMSMMGSVFFLTTGYYLLQIVKMLSGQ